MKKNTVFILALLLLTGELFAQSVAKNIPESVTIRKSYKRYEWFHHQRAFPYDTIPSLYFQKVKRNEQLKYQNSANRSEDPVCEAIGPAGLDINSHPHWGYVSGRVRAIAVHPTNPDIVFIGAASGGLWRSTNGGSSWEDIGHEFSSLTFGAIAIDPVNPDNIYAGGGEWMRYFNSTNYEGRGMYKSTDNGNSWILINNGFGDQTHFSSIEVSPFNHNVIFATLASGYSHNTSPGNEGIWKSTDTGITWINVFPKDDSYDVLPDPVIPDRVYAGCAEGFYISTDNGETWTKSTSGISGLTMERMHLVIPSVEPNIIYLLIYGDSSIRLFKSENSGLTWNSVSQNYDSGQGWYDLLLGVNPQNANEVYIGDAELRKSTNGGSSFAYVGGAYSQQDMHVDFHCMVFAPSNPAIRYIGCDGGIYKSTDSGSSWKDLNTGLSTIQFYRIAGHPTDPQIVFGGAQDNCNFRTTDGGISWGTVTFADGMECFLDYANPDNVYMSVQYGTLYKSTDGGSYNSFYDITPNKGEQSSAWVVPFFIHPFDHNIIYTASDRPWKSTNGGTDWEPMTSGALLNQSIETMTISSLNPNNMILAGGSASVFVTKDGGVNWISVGNNLPDPAREITRVVCDPNDENIMYIVRTGFGSGKVYKSTNLGSSWQNISGDLPDIPHNDLFVDPRIPGHMYVANDFGVYRSINGGIEWSRMGFDIPFVPVMDFDYKDYGDERILFIGTHGRSAYRLFLQQPDGKFLDLAKPIGNESWIEGTDQKILWWSNNINSVDIDFSTDSGQNWNSIAVGIEASLREFVWQVPLINSSECLIRISDSGDATFFDKSNRSFAILPLAIPTVMYPTDHLGGLPLSVNLEWANISGANKYALQVSVDETFTNLIVDENELASCLFELQNLQNNKSYYWRVKSINTGTQSEFSDACAFVTELLKPTLALPENNSKNHPTSVTFNWDDVDGATNYTIQLASNIIFGRVDFEYGGIQESETTISNFVENKKYYWRVKASNELTFGDYSDRWNFQTAQVTSVETNENIPGEYVLYPNYPNPFNPVTKIRFGLPEESFAKIYIYNSLGQFVEEILSDNQMAGHHEVIWDASKYPSGVYVARFQALSNISNRQFINNLKLILVK